MRISPPNDHDDVDIRLGRLPRKLVWGLTKGFLMLAAAAIVTYGAATFLQDYARKQTEQAQHDRPPPQPATAQSPAPEAPVAPDR